MIRVPLLNGDQSTSMLLFARDIKNDVNQRNYPTPYRVWWLYNDVSGWIFCSTAYTFTPNRSIAPSTEKFSVALLRPAVPDEPGPCPPVRALRVTPSYMVYHISLSCADRRLRCSIVGQPACRMDTEACAVAPYHMTVYFRRVLLTFATPHKAARTTTVL